MKLVFAFLLYCSFLTADNFMISEIVLAGNKYITDVDILGQLPLQAGQKLVMPKLAQLSTKISKIYQEKGYYGVIIQHPELIPAGANVKIIIKIDEHAQLPINKLVFTGNRFYSTQRIIERLGLNLPSYTFEQISVLIEDIVDLYAASGYLFSSAKVADYEYNNDGGLTCTLQIDEGAPFRLKKYHFTGNKVSTKESLLRISRLALVEKINEQVLRQGAQNIKRQSYISDCHIFPVNKHELLVSVEEASMTQIEGIVGYNSKEDSGGQRFSGRVKLDFLNLWGTDRNLSFLWEKINADAKISFDYHESGPYVFPIAADFSFSRSEKDSTYIQTKVGCDVYVYTLYNKFGLTLGLDQIFPGVRRPIITESENRHKSGVFWEYNDVDYHLNPRTGKFLYLAYGYLFTNKVRKNIINAEFRQYYQIATKQVLAFESSANYIENKDLDKYDYYHTGGNSSLRGFSENQFEGWAIANFSLEYRRLIGKDSRVFAFVDYAYISQNNDAGKTNNLTDILGVGIGLRIKTRLGIMGIDYGVGHQNSVWTSPAQGMIHFRVEAGL